MTKRRANQTHRSEAAHNRSGTSAASLLERYREVRDFSRALVETLEPEDCVIQSMADVSPTRWHLAHTTWFFETLALAKFDERYRPYHPEYVFLFNSYYNTVGDQFPRPDRGLLSRPTVNEIMQYRDHVDARMVDMLEHQRLAADSELATIIETGLHHEQQHQELMLTDIKHVFSCNPLFPVYRQTEPDTGGQPVPHRWVRFDEGMYTIGAEADDFSYDNERPRHRTFIHAFDLASRLITNGEYLEFMNDKGYQRHELWLAEGFNAVKEQCWTAPLYWYQRDGRWHAFTLSGLRPLDPAEPVCHLSYFEADAFARWAGARLPLETEWEIASQRCPIAGNFVNAKRFHPTPARGGVVEDSSLAQMFGDLWEWTSSPYVPYPGYEPPPGALGE